jgi:hypothetical protein
VHRFKSTLTHSQQLESRSPASLPTSLRVKIGRRNGTRSVSFDLDASVFDLLPFDIIWISFPMLRFRGTDWHLPLK